MAIRRTAAHRRRSAYDLSSEVYDRVYAWKDYRREAVRVHQLVRRYGVDPSRTLLDVCCGTGEHLRYLRRWYRCTGVDASPAMLAVARSKLPRLRFVRGRMQTFRLGERFDVILCLFSAIGYVRSHADLVRTLRNFGRHLRPGGIVLVEPWLTPNVYRAGGIHVQQYGTPEAPIVRVNTHLLRKGRSVMDFHYLLGDGDEVRYWVERHDMALLGPDETRRAFERAGLRVRRIASGFTTRRGLYVATTAVPRGARAGRRRVGRTH